MFKPLLLAAFLVLTQKPEPAQKLEFGSFAGNVTAPEKTAIRQPLQVVIMPEPYRLMWNQKLQQQVDLYWERYKPALVQKKELIFELYRTACQDSLQFVLARMSRELGANLRQYRTDTTPDGSFQFRNIPVGDYKVVVFGPVGNQTYFWTGGLEVSTGAPQFLTLTHRVP